MLNLQRRSVHIWDGETFNKNTRRPVAACNHKIQLYPRDPHMFATDQEIRSLDQCSGCAKLMWRN